MFNASRAWGTMIRGNGKGLFWLAMPDEMKHTETASEGRTETVPLSEAALVSDW